MANIKTLKNEEIKALITRYPTITYSDEFGVCIETHNGMRYTNAKAIRLFFERPNRSKILKIESIKQADRLGIHPVYVQHIRDVYGASSVEISDDFVERIYNKITYDEKVRETHKQKRD